MTGSAVCADAEVSDRQYRYTGKERDAESGNDYFGARYYASTMGRFMSPDPSRLSILPANPQTWNRYSYVYNNPLSLRDDNGKWPTSIHNQIIDQAFPNLTPAQRQILKNVSASQDGLLNGGQAKDLSYMHEMRAPGQSVADAQTQYNNFVEGAEGKANDLQNLWPDEDIANKGLDPEALAAFGEALHAIEDSTSPSHEGFQVWDYNPIHIASHIWRERESTFTLQRRAAAIQAAQDAFNQVFGRFGFKPDNSSVTVTVTNTLPNGQKDQTTF